MIITAKRRGRGDAVAPRMTPPEAYSSSSSTPASRATAHQPSYQPSSDAPTEPSSAFSLPPSAAAPLAAGDCPCARGRESVAQAAHDCLETPDVLFLLQQAAAGLLPVNTAAPAKPEGRTGAAGLGRVRGRVAR